MSQRFIPVTTLAVTVALLAACGGGDAHPIRTGNDYAVTTGGLGSMAGGTVGMAPEQQQPASDPAPVHPGPAVMPPPEMPVASAPMTPAETTSTDNVYAPPPANDMPIAAPAPTYDQTADAMPACEYADMVGKPLTEESVTKLVRLGKIVRELTPDSAATMDFQPNRVNITTDPNTGKILAVTCG